MTDRLGRELLPLLAVDVVTHDGRYLMEGKTKLMKLVFLAQKEAAPAVAGAIAPDSPYQFEPYFYGPFSRDVAADLDSLSRRGLLDSDVKNIDPEGRFAQNRYWLTERGRTLVREYLRDQSGISAVWEVLQRYSNWPGSKVVRHVHAVYPEMVRVTDRPT